MKVMTIVGTRPEIIRLSRIIDALDKATEHLLVHTGQNFDYELNQIFFDDLETRSPDYYLGAAGETAGETIGKVIIATEKVLLNTRPDAVLILGDTNSSLAAIPAKRLKIPIFHMEAGNRCFDQRVPEEINRKIVDHISDINLTYSRIAREYLLRENVPPDRVIKTGSPMYEVLNYYMPKIKSSDVLERLQIETNDYFLVSCHREENIDYEINYSKFINLLKELAKRYNKKIIVTTHPRTRKHIESDNLRLDKKIEFHKPFGFLDYIKLQLNARIVLSDSGTITEEASILNLPALNIRETHERPEGMEEAAVIMVGLEIDRIYEAIQVIEDKASNISEKHKIVDDYNVTDVSRKVVRIILSYTDFVNREIWRKSLS